MPLITDEPRVALGIGRLGQLPPLTGLVVVKKDVAVIGIDRRFFVTRDVTVRRRQLSRILHRELKQPATRGVNNKG